MDNERFWNNTFSGRAASLEDRQNAQLVYDLQKCKNLYEFSVYYLKLDCILLHSIVLTLYKTYLFENLNIVCLEIFLNPILPINNYLLLNPRAKSTVFLLPLPSIIHFIIIFSNKRLPVAYALVLFTARSTKPFVSMKYLTI